MSDTDFPNWFTTITGHAAPHPWQRDLADDPVCRNRLIRIPTGLGKTEGVLAAWSYHRSRRADDTWPRRLVWCLPMRVLVEQTEQVARRLAARMPEPDRPSIHLAMGGEDSGEWFLHPERPAIIIGTQDMLLSRALNRGYASARARWPMEFGLLNQDTLWVMDEVQLMDVGLATSAQLQAFRDYDSTKGLRPCFTWWMSATLQPRWLHTVDTADYYRRWVQNPCVIAPAQRTGGLWTITKTLTTATIASKNPAAFAQRILAEHNQLSDGEFGKITLVVCNTVERACQTMDAITQRRRGETRLIHSRFRPADREHWQSEFLHKKACHPEVDRIIIATQVVEAGVDISATCLITELAPWSSLVQRFGRCARYGGTGRVVVVDRRQNVDDAAPYQPEELESAWETLQQLRDVGISALETHEASWSEHDQQRLYPYTPAHLLLRKEFDELFDTTPDLTGADLDISRFIRSGEERDLHVFWRDIPPDKKGELPHQPPADVKPHRRELCAIPFLHARDWLCGEETKTNTKPKLRRGMRAWVWDWLDGTWVEATRASLLPGRVVCVASDSGGYHPDRGFDPALRLVVPPVVAPAMAAPTRALDEADDQHDGEDLSFTPWKTIACHTQEVATRAREIAQRLGLSKRLEALVELAALWHDWGKAHPAFQGSIRGNDNTPRLQRMDLAKAPNECWPKKSRYTYLDDSETRPAFRHELASALGLFALLQTYAPDHMALLGPWRSVLAELGCPPPNGSPPPPPTPLLERLLHCQAEEFDLVAYLVASHHGKVRVGLHAAPQDQDFPDLDGRGLPIRGVREGDRLPPVVLVPGQPPIPEVTLTLAPAAVGLSCRTGISWRERCIGLLERYGPAALAFLEAILRAADVRASQLPTTDPALTTEATQ
ncbi:MAG: CRISPR-associated endonuclease Cas3'' [Gemmataceae bacterium]|nr:CRISPR-associated endonuclease Cas3'' [Gemmata sp.]MDW8196193.1 CRISPR-associated endonuclease Cas3'' [Gemmataceae bacterium]